MQEEKSFEPTPWLFGSRIALLYAAQFLYVGLYLPYFPIWLKEKALTSFEISTILSMSLVIRVLATSQVTSFADRQPDRANVLTLLYIGSALAILLYLPSQTFWPILMVTLLYNVFFNPVLPILDAITLSGVRRFNADYGKIRIWGSVVFILANFGGGWVLSGYSANYILYALIASMALGAGLSLLVPRFGRKATVNNPEQFKKSGLFSNRNFVLVMAAAGLAQASHAMLYGFGSIYWLSIGIAGPMIGALWAIGVVAEIILFQFSKQVLNWLTPVAMIAIGCVGGVIRWMLFPYVDLLPNPEIIFLLLQVLHGLSFGAVHIGTMHFILQSVPENSIGTAQGAAYVLGGVTMGFGVFASGPIYGAFGVTGFLVMAGLCALGLALLWINRKNALPPHAQPQSS